MKKFRVWDVEKKCYMRFWNVAFSHDGEMWVTQNGHSLELSRKHYIIEQSTGLHDCNGVEIFEGDVVHQFEMANMKDTWFDHEVVLINGAYGYLIDGGKTFISFAENKAFEWNNGKSKYVKAIGNIHEDGK